MPGKDSQITTKRLAEELGVTTQTIRNAVKRLDLDLEKGDSKGFIFSSEQAEQVAKYLNKDLQPEEPEPEAESSALEMTLKMLQEQLNIKDEQLRQKDKQIDELNAHITELIATNKAHALGGAARDVKQIQDIKEETEPIEIEHEEVDISKQEKQKSFFAKFKSLFE